MIILSAPGGGLESLQRGTYNADSSSQFSAGDDWGVSAAVYGWRVPIAAVDMGKAVVVPAGVSSDAVTQLTHRYYPAFRLVSETEIEFAMCSTADAYVAWQVLELNGVNVQRGHGAARPESWVVLDIVVSPVDIERTEIRLTQTHADSSANSMLHAELVDSNTLRLRRRNGSRNEAVLYSWELIEYV